MKNKKIVCFVSLLLVCALMLAGCTNRPRAAVSPAPVAETASPEPEASEAPVETASPEPTETPEPTATPEPTPEPTPEVKYYNPLTGEAVDHDMSAERPVAVMVENNRWDWGGMITQSGITDAAIIYEMQVESITRNMAVFMEVKDVAEILPVRSARSYFVSTALAYDAIYVHCGQSGDGLEYSYPMLAHFVDNDNIDLGEGQNAYRRLDGYYAGGLHAMATSGELLTNHFNAVGTRTTHNADSFDYGLHFTENAAPTDGTVARGIRIVFPQSKLTNFGYNEEKGGYTGYQWDSYYTDNNTQDMPVFQNVLVLATYTQIGIDDHWHTAMNTYDTQGQGYFCNGGYAEHITWSRGGLDTPFRYYTDDGKELELGVGHTYIAFISGLDYVSFYES